MSMSGALDVLAALAPPIGVGLVFWFAMRTIVRADRQERAAIERMARAEAEKQQE